MSGRLTITAPFAYRPVHRPDVQPFGGARHLNVGSVDEQLLRQDAGDDVVNHLLAAGTLVRETVQ